MNFQELLSEARQLVEADESLLDKYIKFGKDFEGNEVILNTETGKTVIEGEVVSVRYEDV